MYDPNEPQSDSEPIQPEQARDPYATDPRQQGFQAHPTIPERPYRTTQTMPVMQQVSRRSGRQNLIGGCMAIGGALLAFGVVALIVTAILLPPWYRAQRPEMQEIWCNRFTRVGMSFVCDFKPTPPSQFLPTPAGTPLPQDALDLLLTPQASPTSSDSSADPGGIGGGSAATPNEQSSVPTATPSPQPSATLLPTSLPSATPIVPTSTPTPVPIPASYSLNVSQLRYQPQTWNNCSGATVSMGLSYFGYLQDQQTAANFLKPNREDKNVSPHQLVNFVNQSASQYMPSQVRALYRVGGDLQLLKTLIANEFPVIIEKGYDVADEGWMGHYLLMVGYDDAQQTFYAYDSYLGHGGGSGRQESYSDTEYFWRQFNYMFVVLYPPEREALLMQLMGSHADPTQAVNIARDRAAQQLQVNQNDNWAWFNLGSSYAMLGNYQQAAQAFDQAFAIGMPWRTLWYMHTPYQAYFAVGRYDDILAHARATESTTVYVEETFYYRGAVLAMQGNTQGAINEFNKALTYNSNFEPARQAITAVQNGTFTRDMILSVGIGLSG